MSNKILIGLAALVGAGFVAFWAKDFIIGERIGPIRPLFGVPYIP